MFPQIPLAGIYDDVCSAMGNNKSDFIQMLEENIDFSLLIPYEFSMAYYKHMGRPREYSLESLIRIMVLQRLIGIYQDSVFLVVLKTSQELRDFCGLDAVPDASQITRFRQDFVGYIKLMFDRLVEVTEPICKDIDAKKADYLVYDTTGVEAYVNENNPKFYNEKLDQAKKMAKNNPDINPFKLVYGLLPDIAEANPFIRLQYVNGHFCYANKAGVLVNGLGVVRDISFFDEAFKIQHPEVVSKKTDNPQLDKEIGDSTSLRPVLDDFYKIHPDFSYDTFLADSAFDTYDTYSMLRNEFNFERIVIPMNTRNSSDKHDDFNDIGTPVCPVDKTPFISLGLCRGKNRAERFKWVCHMSKPIPGSSARLNYCLHPCTDSSYGRCVYTYPDENLRFYPGIPRGTEHWDNFYHHRLLIERTINLLKDPLGVAYRKSFSQRTMKADLLFAGITQLIGVVLAHAIKKPELYKSIRKLVA
jgi:hypothetical protein